MQVKKIDFESSRNPKELCRKIKLLRFFLKKLLQCNQTPKANTIGFIANEMTLKIYISLNVVRNKCHRGDIILFSNIKSCHFLQQPGATENHIPMNN